MELEVDSTTEITQENTKATEPTTEIASTEQTTLGRYSTNRIENLDGYEDNFAVESENCCCLCKINQRGHRRKRY